MRGRALAFYAQHRDVDGLRVEASARVSPYALAEAAWLVRHVIGRADRRTLAVAGVRVVVVGTAERTTELPEYASLAPSIWYDRRYRGMGPTDEIPRVLCAEEDLLDLPGDEVPGDSACVHELAHAVQFAHEKRDPAFLGALHAAYDAAMATGRWADTYSATHPAEYFAVGATAWLDALTPATTPSSRAQLRAYDPELAALCARAFGTWRYTPPTVRRGHLAGFDRASAAPFAWPDADRWDTPERRLPWLNAAPATASGGTPTWVLFENRRHGPVEVARVDAAGVRHPEHTLFPGEDSLQSSAVGEAWIVVDGTRDLGAVVAREAFGYAGIGPSPPPPADPDALARAPRLPLLAEAPAASPAADDETWLVFANHRDHAVTTAWADFAGAVHRFDTVAPGAELVRDAFVGHVWHVFDGDTDLGAIVVPAAPARVEIE